MKTTLELKYYENKLLSATDINNSGIINIPEKGFSKADLSTEQKKSIKKIFIIFDKKNYSHILIEDELNLGTMTIELESGKKLEIKTNSIFEIFNIFRNPAKEINKQIINKLNNGVRLSKNIY